MLLAGSTLAYGGMNWTVSQDTAGCYNARQACANQGGDLVTPLDQSASIALGQWLVDQRIGAAWIGLTGTYLHTRDKKQWYWVGTQQTPAYDGWYTGEPSNDDGGFCAQVYAYGVPAAAVGRWNDASWWSAGPYVCQFAIGTAPCSVSDEHATLASLGSHLLGHAIHILVLFKLAT